MTQPVVTVSIKAASVFMGVCPRHARRILLKRHRNHPEKGLLSRPSGSSEGHLEVNVAVLRAMVLGAADRELDELGERVGFCESDISSLQVRVGRIEKGTSQRKSSHPGRF